ncbi:MAG: glycosyltransferase family 9 protein, partial [Opitutaceae bacterium]
MRRILVLRGGALGDLIDTLPTLALLRQRWPDAHLTLVGNPTAGRLALARGLIAELLSQHEGRWAPLHQTSSLPASLAAWLASFDLVINFWPDPDGALRRHFPTRAGQIFLEAKALPPAGSGPAAAHFQSALNSSRVLFLIVAKPTVASLAASQRGISASPRMNTGRTGSSRATRSQFANGQFFRGEPL